MGVHLVLPARIASGVLSPEQPQALIYEPMANGKMRLSASSSSCSPASGQATIQVGACRAGGNLLNYVGAPNRYGLPAFYEMHVWAWEQNPLGNYADWNTHVTCEHQAAN